MFTRQTVTGGVGEQCPWGDHRRNCRSADIPSVIKQAADEIAVAETVIAVHTDMWLLR
jgi:hypothetical protein